MFEIRSQKPIFKIKLRILDAGYIDEYQTCIIIIYCKFVSDIVKKILNRSQFILYSTL